MGKVKKALLVGVPTAMVTCFSALAAEGDSTAMDIITAQTTQLRTDAVVIIGAGLGIGALFFGAKFLWSKFKGMAK